MKLENLNKAVCLRQELENTDYYIKNVDTSRVTSLRKDGNIVAIPSGLIDRLNNLLLQAAREHKEELIKKIEEL